MRKTIVLAGISLGLSLLSGGCGPPRKVVTLEVTADGLKAQQAEALVRKGHYRAFKDAVRVYAGLYARPSLRAKIAGPYAQACILLALREKDIGIDNPATIAAAEKIVRENPQLTGLSACATLVKAMPPRTRGVMRDIDTTRWTSTNAQALKDAETALRKSAPADEFSAYILAAWSCSFGRYSEGWRDPAQTLKGYPDSLLIRYAVATCGEARPELLEEILAREPDFAEAHFHLGEAALGEGRLIDAERYLLTAYEAIPETPQTRILLAGIYFATEEFDRSLEFYDLTLDVSPAYRDALLGKAICLSYLGRFDESMAALNRILELGYWLLGEAHYWLAWDLHALKRDTEALGHIDEAKGRLPTNSEVFGLAGTIALDLGELERAEADFRESLKYNPANMESLFGLGTVTGRKGLWEKSADYYEQAGRASDSWVSSLRAKIDEIRASALSDDRKARLVRRREAQIDRGLLAGATAYYDAAAAFANAGLKDKAFAAAAKAAGHPALKAKTEELLRSIKH